MNNIAVRKATSGDIPVMINLLQQLFSIEEDFDFDDEKQKAGLNMMLKDQSSRILVAINGDNVIGMATLQTLISTAMGDKVGIIEDVVVDSAHRGKGIGSLLMSSLEKEAQAMGLKRLQLLADKNNKPALDFYESINWGQTQLICLRKK